MVQGRCNALWVLLIDRKDEESEPYERTFRNAMEHFGFNYVGCLEKSANTFCVWLKNRLEEGCLVSMGVILPTGNEREEEYDHIVTVVCLAMAPNSVIIYDPMIKEQFVGRISDLVQPNRATVRRKGLPFAVKNKKFYAVAMHGFALPAHNKVEVMVTKLEVWVPDEPRVEDEQGRQKGHWEENIKEDATQGRYMRAEILITHLDLGASFETSNNKKSPVPVPSRTYHLQKLHHWKEHDDGTVFTESVDVFVAIDTFEHVWDPTPFLSTNNMRWICTVVP